MTPACTRRRRTTNASNGVITMYNAVMNPERPADPEYRMPYCWTVLAVNSTTPQMTLATTGLPSQAGIVIFRPSPKTTSGPCPAARRARSLRAMPSRRNHSSGSNETAPNVKRVAPKNNGVVESMPCTWDTNANPQIMAVNTRQVMPPISFLCMSHHRRARITARKKPDHILVRLGFPRRPETYHGGYVQSRLPSSWRMYRNMFTKSRYRFSAQMMEIFLTMSSPCPAYCAISARVACAS